MLRRDRRLALSTAAVVALMCGALTGTGGASAQSTGTDGGHGGANRPWLPPTPDQWPLVVNASQTSAQEVTRGIEYHTDTYQSVGGVQHSTELNVDLTDPNVRLGVVESHNVLNDASDEIVSSMANRTGAVAGINGDFFDIYGSGRPHGMVVIDGRLVKSPNPAWNQNLVVRADGSIGIGTEAYSGTATDGTASHPITSVNTVEDLSANGLVRITPDLGDSGKIPASVVVSGHRDPAAADALVVDAVTPDVTDIAPVPAGTTNLVGSGTPGKWLAATAPAGGPGRASTDRGPAPHGPRQAQSPYGAQVASGRETAGPGRRQACSSRSPISAQIVLPPVWWRVPQRSANWATRSRPRPPSSKVRARRRCGAVLLESETSQMSAVSRIRRSWMGGCP